MDTGTANRLQIKIFVGFEFKVDIRISLNKNSKWKEAKVSKTTQLKEVHFQEQEYIGVFLPSEMTTMKILQDISQQVRTELQNYCPENDLSNSKIQVFPQVFVA